LFEVEKYGKSFVLLKINGNKQTFIGSHFLGVKPTYPNRYFGALEIVREVRRSTADFCYRKRTL